MTNKMKIKGVASDYVWEYSNVDGVTCTIRSGDTIFTYPIEQIRTWIGNGSWEVLEGSFGQQDETIQELINTLNTLKEEDMLNKIKQFTSKYSADVIIEDGVYRVLDHDTTFDYSANDEDTLIKIMDALVFLESVYVS